MDGLDTLLRKGGDTGPWMQRDIVCALQKPRRKLLKGEEVHGLEIPFCLRAVVSRWESSGEYIDTPCNSVVVSEGAVMIPENGGPISIYMDTSDTAVTNNGCEVL